MIYTLGYFTLPKLVEYTNKLYNFKKKQPTKKRREIRFFTFLPKTRRKISLFNKILSIGVISALLFFILVSINYEAPSPYLLENTTTALDNIKDLDPFKNTNPIIFFIMSITLLLNFTTLFIVIYRFMEKFILIVLYKTVKTIYTIIKTLFVKIFHLNKTKPVTE